MTTFRGTFTHGIISTTNKPGLMHVLDIPNEISQLLHIFRSNNITEERKIAICGNAYSLGALTDYNNVTIFGSTATIEKVIYFINKYDIADIFVINKSMVSEEEYSMLCKNYNTPIAKTEDYYLFLTTNGKKY